MSDSRVGTRPAGMGPEIALVALLTLLNAAFAVAIFPVWVDDSVFSEMLRDHLDLPAVHLDRPVMGHFWHWASDQGILIPATAVVYYLSWAGLALGGVVLWRHLYPRFAAYGGLIACLTLTPALCQCQWVLINFPLSSIFGPALAMTALGILLSSGEEPRSLIPRLVVAFVLVFLGGQISEYSAPTAVLGAAILVLRKWWDDEHEASFRTGAIAAATLVLAALASYAVFYAYLAEPSARARVRPEVILQSAGIWKIKVFVPKLLTLVWQSIFGGFFHFLGTFRVASYETMFGVAIGLITAIAVVLVVRNRAGRAPVEGPLDDPRPSLRTSVLLFLALVVTLVPMIAMGAVPGDRQVTRYLLPLLPAASCLTVGLLLWMMDRRAWWLLALAIGFGVGFGPATEYFQARSDARQLARWSGELREELAPEGITVAIFTFPWQHGDLLTGSPFELTSRLTADWPRDEAHRFWALNDLNQIYSDNGPIDLFSDEPKVDFQIRGVGRTGDVARILWLEVAGGKLVIHADDLGARPSREPAQPVEPAATP